MNLRELLRRPATEVIRFNARSSARWLYFAAAVVLAWSAGCDVVPTSIAVRSTESRAANLVVADACLRDRWAELGRFNAQRAQLQKALRPYVSNDASAAYFRNEYAQREKFGDVSFVHSNPPQASSGVPAPGATPSPTPDPFAGPTHGPTPDPIPVHGVAKAESCLAQLDRPDAAPSAQASSTPSPPPSFKAFVGKQFELELRGGAQQSLYIEAALSQTKAVLSASDVTFEVIQDNHQRVLSSKTLLGLYNVVLPTPVPTLPPLLPAPTDSFSPAPVVTGSPASAAARTAEVIK